MPRPEHVEVAQLLLEKATGDLAALRVLAADQNQADHVVGFHAQQAVEKSIKAVLASREIEIPMTHDLGYLVTLVEALPTEVAESRWLTPWAGGATTPKARRLIANGRSGLLSARSSGPALSFSVLPQACRRRSSSCRHDGAS